MIASVLKFLLYWKVSTSALELEKVLPYLEHPMKLSDQEGQVMNAT
jgi:hypothetical protein